MTLTGTWYVIERRRLPRIVAWRIEVGPSLRGRALEVVPYRGGRASGGFPVSKKLSLGWSEILYQNIEGEIQLPLK